MDTRQSSSSALLLYPWLGSCYVGEVAGKYLHVKVRGLAAVGSPQPTAQGI